MSETRDTTETSVLRCSAGWKVGSPPHVIFLNSYCPVNCGTFLLVGRLPSHICSFFKKKRTMNPFKDILNDGKTLPAAGRCSVGKFVSPRDQVCFCSDDFSSFLFLFLALTLSQTTQFTFLSVDTKDVENESPSREKIRRQSVGKVNRSPMQKRKSSVSTVGKDVERGILMIGR